MQSILVTQPVRFAAAGHPRAKNFHFSIAGLRQPWQPQNFTHMGMAANFWILVPVTLLFVSTEQGKLIRRLGRAT